MSYFDHSPVLTSQLVLPADEAATRWTLRADLAVIEPQLARQTVDSVYRLGRESVGLDCFADSCRQPSKLAGWLWR